MQRFDKAGDNGKRRAQFVAGIGNEILLHLFQLQGFVQVVKRDDGDDFAFGKPRNCADTEIEFRLIAAVGEAEVHFFMPALSGQDFGERGIEVGIGDKLPDFAAVQPGFKQSAGGEVSTDDGSLLVYHQQRIGQRIQNRGIGKGAVFKHAGFVDPELVHGVDGFGEVAGFLFGQVA